MKVTYRPRGKSARGEARYKLRPAASSSETDSTISLSDIIL